MNDDMKMGEVEEQAAMGSGVGTPKVTVEEVIQLLMQGVQPQELVDAGVPVELIEQAIMVMQEQMNAQGSSKPAGQGMEMGKEQGLASKMIGM